MSRQTDDDRWLASLDPVDTAEIRSLLESDDLANRIMAIPAPPARRSALASARHSIGCRIGTLIRTPSPSFGRAAFAATVAGIVVAAASLLALAPGRDGDQQTRPAAGTEAPLDATTTTTTTTTTTSTTALAVAVALPETTDGQATPAETEISLSPLATGPTSTGVGVGAGAASSIIPPSSPTSSASATLPTTSSTTGSTSRRVTTAGPTSAPTTLTAAPSTTSRRNPDHGDFDTDLDLLALHYDNVGNRDDGHSAVAAKEIVDDLRIDAIVIGGTYSSTNNAYIKDSETVMDAAWGPDGWMNAHTDRSAAVTAAVERWGTVLDAGGEVWVAEAGQSDYTADVVRAVAAARPGQDIGGRIHVVQHSVNNMDETSSRDLSYIRDTTDFVKIDNGNYSNATADLNRFDEGFTTATRSSHLASAWEQAYDYLDPSVRLDFSHTVEVLHIVGIGPDLVADPADFARYFMG